MMAAALRLALALSLLVVQAVPVSQTHAREQALKQTLQRILDKHSNFWNASFSLGVSNQSMEVAVVSGQNDYADPNSKLTTDSQIPMGSTTKFFTAVSLLRLAAAGNLSLDDRIAPYVDAYLATPLPCAEAPDMCESDCVPWAHCYAKPDAIGCKMQSKSHKASCSYCFRYLHCFQGRGMVQPPTRISLKQLWDNQPEIEQVTFRQLLSMTSGIKDYYFDQ